MHDEHRCDQRCHSMPGDHGHAAAFCRRGAVGMRGGECHHHVQEGLAGEEDCQQGRPGEATRCRGDAHAQRERADQEQGDR